jgi:hypothetical protein
MLEFIKLFTFFKVQQCHRIALNLMNDSETSSSDDESNREAATSLLFHLVPSGQSVQWGQSRNAFLPQIYEQFFES